MDLTGHQNTLLAGGRCGRCAERVSRSSIVRVGECPHCGSQLTYNGGEVLENLETRRLHWRLFGYGLVGVGSFFAGAIPLLQVLVQLVALFVLHVVVLRRGLAWLSPGRRVLGRISIKMLGAALAATALLVNVAIAPLVGISAFILGAVGPLLTAAYVEGGLIILRRRLRWESQDKPLHFSEWALPAGFMLALVGVIGGIIAATLGTLHLLTTMDVPTVSELAETLLELAP
ncbi:MAG: hypothetical protein ACQEVA_22135 [Myxococcota bacterium]